MTTSKNLAAPDSALPVAAPADPLTTLLADPSALSTIPIETVERLFALDRANRADRAREEFAIAMAAAQSECTPVRKLAQNKQTHSMYARVEDVERMLDPILHRHGFSRSVSTVEPVVVDTMRVCLLLRHVGGHEERHYLDAAPDTLGPQGKAVKTALHGMGSTLTYCGRHLLCNVFGITLTADDDGNAGGAHQEPVNEHQLADLRALIEEVDADEGALLELYGIKALADLPAVRFKSAVRALEFRR